jgi:hypothetical protein
MLCYVMVPLQHARQRRGIGVGGCHGIRSVRGGAQPTVVRVGCEEVTCARQTSLRVGVRVEVRVRVRVRCGKVTSAR